MIILILYVIFCFWIEMAMSRNPNFIFILTDDQGTQLDSLKPMQKTLELIANNGVFFQNAFANTPICCPSRSSILTGKYAHNIGVVNNSINGNCSNHHWQNNFEADSIASILKRTKSYSTFYGGKYLNQYGSEEAGGVEHVPPGYDWWVGLKGNSRYHNYTLSLNGTGKYYENDYLTDLLKKFALDFLKWNYMKPFFMTIATPACHAPFTAADRHKSKFPEAKAVRNPAFNYSSRGKHWIVTMSPEHLPTNVSRLDVIQRKRLQTLLAVDEMVESLVQELRNLEIYDDTHLIFSSDHGYHIGQFGQPWDKRQPYESDIRIPFMISGPNIPKKKIIPYPITSIDIAPTILDLASVPIPKEMDGRSFKKQLTEQEDFDKFILIEYWGEGSRTKIDKECPWRSDELLECTSESWCKCQDSKNNTYTCVLHLSKNKNFKICHFYDDMNFREAYNLNADPFELQNIYRYLNTTELTYYKKILYHLQHCKGKTCDYINA